MAQSREDHFPEKRTSCTPDGTVTCARKIFTGEGTGVTVKRVDKNGTGSGARKTNQDCCA